MTGPALSSRSFESCVIEKTHRRLRHAHILWHQASDSYQNVDAFLTNVNSLIQELRNITFTLQKEKHFFKDFKSWYTPWQNRLKANESAKWASDIRTEVVHEYALVAASRFNLKILTYYELPIASFLTSTDADLDILSIFKRKDFINAVAHVRMWMKDQGNAIVALERCWSTPDLKGSEILQVLGKAYGLIAQTVLDAHVHLGQMDCIDSDDAHPEFPRHSERSPLLPCMMREQAARVDYFKLNKFEPLYFQPKIQPLGVKPADVEWRYQTKLSDRLEAYDSLDPVKLYEHMVWSSKRMLKKDRSLGRNIMLRTGKGEWRACLIMAEDRAEKYLLMHLLADTVREEGCDALVEVGEVWLTDPRVTFSQLESIEMIPNRKKHIREAVMVRLDTRDGIHKESLTVFTRGQFGGIKLSDTTEEDEVTPNYLVPVYKVWLEQREYSKANGSKLGVWKPEYSDSCVCGSGKSYATCCFPQMGGLEELSFADFDALLKAEKLNEAERHARAVITRYACWIRQHIPIFSNESDGMYSDEILAVDCLAIEANFVNLESWALRTGNIDAVVDAYRRVEEIVGVPAIVRRLIALCAKWMVTRGQMELGMLELGRLGDVSKITDCRALVLLAEHGGYERDDRISFLRKAAKYALEDDERTPCLYGLASELHAAGSDEEALKLANELIDASDVDLIRRGALAIKWEITQADEDFKRVFDQMLKTRSDRESLSAAGYLLSKRRPDAALEVLEEMLTQDVPVAQILAAECDVRLGDCKNAEARLTSVDASKEGLRAGVAFVRALLVLDCGREDLKDEVLKALSELSPSAIPFDLPRLIEAVRNYET